MRPQQQNRRMRSRNSGGSNNNNNNNNNRRGPNPLTRSYESNGPDVKIRGSAQQVAEKYATLARDAMSSGDRVMAENYLQHAEHYNRIIMAAQAQFASQQIQSPRDEFDDDMDEGGFGFEGGMNGTEPQPQSQHTSQPQQGQQRHQHQPQQQPVSGSGPQPDIEGVPAEVALNSEAGGQQSGGGQRERRPYRDRYEPRHRDNRSNGTPVEPSPESTAAAPAETPASEPPAAVAAPAEMVAADAGGGDVAAPETQAAAAAPAAPRTRRPRRSRSKTDSESQPAQDGNEELAPAEG